MSSAPRNFDLYIGNFNKDVTSTDLTDYIHNETNIKVIACEELPTRRGNSNSFKVSTTYEGRESLLKESVGPEGIYCRKFYLKKKSSV